MAGVKVMETISVHPYAPEGCNLISTEITNKLKENE